MSGDLISRSMVLLAIDRNISNMRKAANGDRMANKAIDLVQITRDFIANHPAAAAERTGRWELKRHKLFGNSYDYVCSACGCDYALAEYNYCPNCGAKMEQEADK